MVSTPIALANSKRRRQSSSLSGLMTPGVISPDNEEDWRRLFEFAKAMGVETISSEPDEKLMPLNSQHCDEYEVNLAIHNRAAPTEPRDPKRRLTPHR